ncbi:MAG TPA: Ig-like domain repeat protein, partial [Verrucomicrobiae bacterium]|nr:Ig-like domain repeat protein [Verrucomicrobiae bacterium]
GGTKTTGGQLIYYNQNNSFGTGAITIAGTGGAMVNNGAAGVTLNNPVTITTTGWTLNLASGAPSGSTPGTIWSGGWTLPAGTTGLLTGGSGQVTEISGIISGSGAALTVGNGGTLELGGVNTYSGATTISNSTVLSIIGSGSLGGGSYSQNITNGGTFTYASSASQTLSGAIWGAGGTFNVNGSGTLTLSGSGDNNSLGANVNSGGVLVLGKASTSGVHALGGATTVNSGGTLRLGGSGNDQIFDGASVTVNSGGVFDMNGLNETMAGLSLSGTGISSGGALINNNGSTTSTNTGAVTLGADSSIGGSANIMLASAVGGAHVLTKIGNGTVKLNSANTYSLGTAISAGTLEVAGSIAGNVTNNAGVLKIDNNTALASGATLTLAASPSANAVNLNFSSGTQTVNALYFGGIQKAAGTWAASGATHNNTAFTGAGVLNVTTGPASTTSVSLTSGSNPSTYGNSLTFTATVTGNSPGGTVQFKVDGVSVGSPVTLVSGSASLTTSTLSVSGSPHHITAFYSGDDNNNASNNSAAPASQTVNPASLGITANNDSKTYGQTRTYGAGSTAFTSSGLQSGETIGSVTLASSGGGANAAVSGSPYTITPSAATGGSFNAANYTITYNDGSLAVNPLAATLTGTRAYDGTSSAAAAILSVANKVGGDDVTVASGSGTLAGSSV